MMKNKYKKTYSAFKLIALFVVAGFSYQASANTYVNKEDHGTFERRFADMCVEKEKADLKGSGVLLAEVISLCECIALEESKRVTSEEVREVKEGHFPASLMMKSNAATYSCVNKHQ